MDETRIIGSSRIEIDGDGKILCSVSSSDRVQRVEVDPRTTLADLLDALARASLELQDDTTAPEPGGRPRRPREDRLIEMLHNDKEEGHSR